jgi:hypothetical protein
LEYFLVNGWIHLGFGTWTPHPCICLWKKSGAGTTSGGGGDWKLHATLKMLQEENGGEINSSTSTPMGLLLQEAHLLLQEALRLQDLVQPISEGLSSLLQQDVVRLMLVEVVLIREDPPLLQQDVHLMLQEVVLPLLLHEAERQRKGLLLQKVRILLLMRKNGENY